MVIVPENGKIGAYVAPNIEPIIYKYSFFSSLVAGGKEVGQQIVFSLRTLGVMIRTTFSSSASREQKQEVTASVGGPVALGRAFVDLADHGVQFRSLIIMTALISLSL